jgi:vitamin B12 transporter
MDKFINCCIYLLKSKDSDSIKIAEVLMLRNKIAAFLLLVFSVLSLAPPVLAMSDEDRKNFMKMSEDERKFLLMYFDEDELYLVSATRSLKSISRVAENVEVVTAADIELMNAHTVADVLNFVNGVQVQFSGPGPGAIAATLIQGSNSRHVAVFIDGVPMPDVGENITDVGTIPVQFVEKIEVIKGPASSVWGSSLGGIVNIITKSPATTEGAGGTVSAANGEYGSGDFRAEIAGKKGRFGFYVFAGRLQKDNFRPGFDFGENNAFTKLSYEISKNTKILFTSLYDKGSRGNRTYSDDFENVLSYLSLESSLSKALDLSITLKAGSLQRDFDFTAFGLGINNMREDTLGAAARLTWRNEMHTVVLGLDYDDSTLDNDFFLNGDQKLRKGAAYINDTITWDKLSVTPGLRYDTSNNYGDFISPSLGITYEIFDKTILRAYVARGFSAPALNDTSGDNPGFAYQSNPDLEPEKVWSYQLGAETGALKYFWLKVAAFRHDIDDVIIDDFDVSDPAFAFTRVNGGRQRRQGLEIETRTISFWNTSLSAGATFIDTEDRDTGKSVPDVPKYTYDFSVKYDDQKTFKALLQGHYIWWNMSSDFQGKYSSLIVDLNMIKTLYKQNGREMEAFVTAHNLFDGSQYWNASYKSAERWIEGGLRVKF